MRDIDYSLHIGAPILYTISGMRCNNRIIYGLLNRQHNNG